MLTPNPGCRKGLGPRWGGLPRVLIRPCSSRRAQTLAGIFLSFEIFLTIFFALQERSPTNARFVAKPSARAPTSSPTAASTLASSPSAVSSVPRVSNVRWTYGGTGRPNTVSSEGWLQFSAGGPTASACFMEDNPPQHFHPAWGLSFHPAHIASCTFLRSDNATSLALVFLQPQSLTHPSM